jgi:hypothetical protein
MGGAGSVDRGRAAPKMNSLILHNHCQARLGIHSSISSPWLDTLELDDQGPKA